MKAISAIINFFLFWNKISVKYDRIKKDEEKRKNHKERVLLQLFIVLYVLQA